MLIITWSRLLSESQTQDVPWDAVDGRDGVIDGSPIGQSVARHRAFWFQSCWFLSSGSATKSDKLFYLFLICLSLSS